MTEEKKYSPDTSLRNSYSTIINLMNTEDGKDKTKLINAVYKKMKIPSKLKLLLQPFSKKKIVNVMLPHYFHGFPEDLKYELIDKLDAKTSYKIVKLIDTYNFENAPKDVREKTKVLMCQSLYDEFGMKQLYTHKEFSELETYVNKYSFNNFKKYIKNNYVTIDPSGLGPADVAFKITKKLLINYFPKQHYDYCALVYCPIATISKDIIKFIEHAMKDGSIIEMPRDVGSVVPNIANFFQSKHFYLEQQKNMFIVHRKPSKSSGLVKLFDKLKKKSKETTISIPKSKKTISTPKKSKKTTVPSSIPKKSKKTTVPSSIPKKSKKTTSITKKSTVPLSITKKSKKSTSVPKKSKKTTQRTAKSKKTKSKKTTMFSFFM